MAELSYTITDLPAVWPGKKTTSRIRAPFKTVWSKTTDLLARELRHLGARKVEMALEIRGAIDLRQDGMLRADARPGPAVVLSFLDRDGQRQAYPCDRFAWWQDNLYAIAIVLEDLRRAERYGVQSSLIRAGFKALPPSTKAAMSTEGVAEFLRKHTGYMPDFVLGNKNGAQMAVRLAASRLHPDAGGRVEDFQLLQEAKRILEAHHGASL